MQKTATDSEQIEAARQAVKDYYAALKAKNWVAAGVMASEKNIHKGAVREKRGTGYVTVTGDQITANLLRASWGPLVIQGWKLRRVTVRYDEIKGSHMIGFKVAVEAMDDRGRVRRGTAKPNALLESLGWRVNVPSATICWG